MKKKQIGWLRLYRDVAMIYKRDFTDQEYRLADIYACLAYWDKRREDYGTVEISINDLRLRHLPDWSRTKISNVRKSLIKKGFLSSLPKNTVRVDKLWMYQGGVREVGQRIRNAEQQIQPMEHHVPPDGEQRPQELQDLEQNIVDTFKVISL